MEEIVSQGLRYCIGESGIKIIDSYSIKKADFDGCLDRIQRENPEHRIWSLRSRCSLKNEWAVHNFCYRCHILVSHTADVDLDTELKWYFKVAYSILGPIAKLFIE